MAGKKIFTMKSIFYTIISLVWIFGLTAIGHIAMVLVEKYWSDIQSVIPSI